MQKINKIFFTMVLALSAPLVWADIIDSDAVEVVKADEISLDQEQLLAYLSSSIEFETQKNDLTNQIALERLRLELANIKSSIMEVDGSSSYNSWNSESQYTAPKVSQDPKIILFSEVAGLSKFGVSIDGSVIFVSVNQTFANNDGKKYAVMKSNNKYVVLGK